jgi:hypothetical protein
MNDAFAINPQQAGGPGEISEYHEVWIRPQKGHKGKLMCLFVANEK